MSIFEQNPKRPGAGASSDKATGKGPRVGNQPHTNTGNNDQAPQRHTTGGGKVEKTSENWPTRENAVQTGETFSGKGGQFEFQTASPNESSYTQRSRVPRQEVKDAEIKSLSDKRFKNEKDQRKVSESLEKDITNPRNQR